MFQESPFSGLCAYSTLEVIIMLVGTLLLGLLLGYLIWGWTRRKLHEAEAKILKLTANNTNLKQQVSALKEAQSDQQDEFDKLSIENDTLKRRLDSLYLTNSNLKQQYDDLVISGQDVKTELAKVHALATTNDALISNLYTQLSEEQENTTKLKKALKKALSSKSKKIIPDDLGDSKRKKDKPTPTAIPSSKKIPFTEESPIVEDVPTELLEIPSQVFGKEVFTNDLSLIEGIGPKIADVLKASGITTWMQLSNTTRHILRVILDEAGSKFRGHKPKTWPRQARMAANGEWKKLKAYQDILLGGKVSNN